MLLFFKIFFYASLSLLSSPRALVMCKLKYLVFLLCYQDCLFILHFSPVLHFKISIDFLSRNPTLSSISNVLLNPFSTFYILHIFLSILEFQFGPFCSFSLSSEIPYLFICCVCVFLYVPVHAYNNIFKTSLIIQKSCLSHL